jgi:hypothetical protein
VLLAVYKTKSANTPHSDGSIFGVAVGEIDGIELGISLGFLVVVGDEDGIRLGISLGLQVGVVLGDEDGIKLGVSLGG